MLPYFFSFCRTHGSRYLARYTLAVSHFPAILSPPRFLLHFLLTLSDDLITRRYSKTECNFTPWHLAIASLPCSISIAKRDGVERAYVFPARYFRALLINNLLTPSRTSYVCTNVIKIADSPNNSSIQEIYGYSRIALWPPNARTYRSSTNFSMGTYLARDKFAILYYACFVFNYVIRQDYYSQRDLFIGEVVHKTSSIIRKNSLKPKLLKEKLRTVQECRSKHCDILEGRTFSVIWNFSRKQVAAILVENNASLKAATKNGFTPLHIAAKYGNMNVANILLQKDSKLDVQGKVRAHLLVRYIGLCKRVQKIPFRVEKEKRATCIFSVISRHLTIIFSQKL